eukprot:scaffold48786_cov61-Phaeocystis_antarctica.AAC.5
MAHARWLGGHTTGQPWASLLGLSWLRCSLGPLLKLAQGGILIMTHAHSMMKHVSLGLCLGICLSVYLSICLSVRPCLSGRYSISGLPATPLPVCYVRHITSAATSALSSAVAAAAAS